jgi:hypothetical protein
MACPKGKYLRHALTEVRGTGHFFPWAARIVLSDLIDWPHSGKRGQQTFKFELPGVMSEISARIAVPGVRSQLTTCLLPRVGSKHLDR